MQKKERWAMLAMVGICLAASIGLTSKAWGEQFVPSTVESKNLLQVKVYRLIIDSNSQQPIVFLADPQEERGLLVWIGPCEANALNGEMGGTKPPRPLTHDLAVSIIEKLKGKIHRIIITHVQEGIYYATLVIEREGAIFEIDARPSDSIVMAMKSKSPIFVSKGLFAELSVPLKEEKEGDDPYGLTIQELTSSLAQSFSYKSTKGVLVADVRGGSQAEKDGLQPGDIIVEVGSGLISDAKSLRDAFSKSKVSVKARIFRKGNYVSLSLNPKK